MLILPIKKQWFDMILSGEKKRRIQRYEAVLYISLRTSMARKPNRRRIKEKDML